jgi:hypothetical protein
MTSKIVSRKFKLKVIMLSYLQFPFFILTLKPNLYMYFVEQLMDALHYIIDTGNPY